MNHKKALAHVLRAKKELEAACRAIRKDTDVCSCVAEGCLIAVRVALDHPIELLTDLAQS